MRCVLDSIKVLDLASGILCLLKWRVSGKGKGKGYKQESLRKGMRCGLGMGSISVLDLTSGRLCLLK